VEVALRESEANLAAGQRHAKLGSWELDLATLNAKWSAEMYRLFDCDPLAGVPGYAQFLELVHPDDRRRLAENESRAVRTGELVSYDYRSHPARGPLKHFNVTIHVLRDAAGNITRLGGTVQDITDRKRTEAALLESEARYRTLFERAPDGIVVANAEGRYIDANTSICQMLGYDRDELVGLHSSELVVEEEIRHIEPALEMIKTRSDYQREWKFRRKDGSVLEAEVLANMIPDGHILAMIRDITERRGAEQKIAQLNAELEQRVNERTAQLEAANKELEAYSSAVTRDLRVAEAADRIKSAFLATMSHELRTPLNSIIGFTSIVLMGKAGPLHAEQKKQLEMVRESAWHLLALINDVLDISKIEAGQVEVRAAPFHLPASIDRVLSMIRPLAEKKGLMLAAEVVREVNEMVSDQRRVEQILINLLSNAVKFTEQGRVALTVDLVADFRLSPQAEACRAVRLRVTDTGIGIKSEDLALLFQPFQQLEIGPARQVEGTGLGLAICRRLATLLGGEISAASLWSKGSEFTVILPLQNITARELDLAPDRRQ
jgi:PAS domain S-box-containing protein